ncbi:unnamed protein product [Prorocentrum cordatum]|uniref:Uncharacterized protein n=1 Tax=Prorocentrum cordatum TaxID=2364126 RepID=A0ABN9TDD7_9DINO|nr:unnamed protein product [Polarella glacialis]
MQAVLFSQLPGGGVDFWWVKPRKDEAGQLEPMFLALHRRGSFKNDPGRSRPIYAPLAEKFSRGADGDFVFGVDGSGRAFIEESREGNARERMLLYLVWQEAWSGVFSSEKFIRGKILYQKGAPGGLQEPGSNSSLFFAREYEIRDGQLTLSAVGDEEILPALLPPDSFQGMCTEFG